MLRNASVFCGVAGDAAQTQGTQHSSDAGYAGQADPSYAAELGCGLHSVGRRELHSVGSCAVVDTCCIHSLRTVT